MLLHFFVALYRFYLYSTLYEIETKNHKLPHISDGQSISPSRKKKVYIVFAFLEVSCGIPVKFLQISKYK